MLIHKFRRVALVYRAFFLFILLSVHFKSMVRPFVEVMFQGNFLRTSVADGAWPNWNEDLVLPFK